MSLTQDFIDLGVQEHIGNPEEFLKELRGCHGCDFLELKNKKLRATLEDLRDNYTVRGEDAYNLIEEALKGE